MSRQDLPRKQVEALGASIVHVVNISDHPFKVEANSQPYILPPRTKRPVLRRYAELWLGDPLATEQSISGNKWSQEMARLKNLHGAPDATATSVRNKVNQFELVTSGKVYCPEFGQAHLSKLQNMTPEVRTALMGIPLEQDEIAAAMGSIPLSKQEVNQYQAETTDAILKVQEMVSSDYVGYGVDDDMINAMVHELS